MSAAPDGGAGGRWRPFELCPGVHALFTGRSGGASTDPFAELNMSGAIGDDPAAVAANRHRVAAACGLPATGMAWMEQVHGADVRYVPAGQGSPRADAIFTDRPELALGVLVADCAPVLIADPAARLVGAAHAGREGMVAGVVPALVAALAAAGADPGRMHAIIGPAICGGCYEVPAEMRGRVTTGLPEAGCVTRTGTPGIDLRSGLRAQLAAAGIRRVSDDGRCTAETPDLYSYRRDGRTGRSAGLIWLTS